METDKVKLPTADPDHMVYAIARLGALREVLPRLYFTGGLASKKTLILKSYIDNMLTKCENTLKEGPEATYDQMKKHLLEKLD